MINDRSEASDEISAQTTVSVSKEAQRVMAMNSASKSVIRRMTRYSTNSRHISLSYLIVYNLVAVVIVTLSLRLSRVPFIHQMKARKLSSE